VTKNETGTKLPREIALDIVMEITEGGNFSHKVLKRTLGEYQYLEKYDRAFITRLCDGTIERLITLDYIINQSSKIKVNKMKPLIRNLLRISVYQIKYMDNVPDSAICNEAVKLAKKRGFTNLSGFVNGVLRNIIREPEKSVLPKDNLSIMYSVPEWLVKELLSQYDYETVKNILEASFNESETSIRLDTNRVSKEELFEMLAKQNITVKTGNYLPYAFKISNYNYLSDVEAFMKGYIGVQDESSMLVGQIAGVKKDDYVIDVCAAPGGKSLHIASLLNGTGHVCSRDVSDYKINLINENITRLGYKNISTKVMDALTPNEEDNDKADIVIADVPCSGLGVIGKKPDIKYNMTKEKLDNLKILQQDILKVVSRYVKKGGTLIYSTCTINQMENIKNVEWFLNSYDFTLESFDEYIPKSLQCESTKKGFLQLIPGIHNTDGFFIARLRRNS
jgi:16S rRNA (cytosine967-C5)-methyltransferase